MDAQDMRMCNSGPLFAGETVDHNHGVYDEDYFGDILNILDFPMENVEGDSLAEDWASKLGPIPSEVFRELLPPVSHIGIGNGNGNGSSVESPIKNAKTSQLKKEATFFEENRPYPNQRAFEALSPDSVLESRSSSSSRKDISYGTEISIPVRTRSKRGRSSNNPWLKSLLLTHNKEKKKKKPSHRHSNTKTNNSLEKSKLLGIKKCTHCEITKTPQWREGPMGPKTLCNACGVRYRSGRLFPEYRPAASPTYVPSLHSNSHRKVIEMREKATNVKKGAGMNKTYDMQKPLVPKSEFVSVSSSLFDRK